MNGGSARVGLPGLAGWEVRREEQLQQCCDAARLASCSPCQPVLLCLWGMMPPKGALASAGNCCVPRESAGAQNRWVRHTML